jgi:hypothetical protein
MGLLCIGYDRVPVPGVAVDGRAFEEFLSQLDRILPEGQLFVPTLLLQLKQLAFQRSQPPGPIRKIVDLNAEAMALNLQVPLVDIPDVPLVKPTPLIKQVGLVLQADMVGSELLAKDLCGEVVILVFSPRRERLLKQVSVGF